MTIPLVIMGTGGNCIDILETVYDINDASGKEKYLPIGFLDDNTALWDQSVHGIPVLGGLAKARDLNDTKFIFAIGSPKNYWKRGDILANIGLSDEQFVTLIHPTAYCSRSSRLGRGTVLLQQVCVASSAKIGSHVLVLPQTIVSHDDAIGDYSLIAGGVCVSGNVVIGEHCYLGTNSSIRGGVKIGSRVMIGMGSTILNNVDDDSVYVGNPGRLLRRIARNQEATLK